MLAGDKTNSQAFGLLDGILARGAKQEDLALQIKYCLSSTVFKELRTRKHLQSRQPAHGRRAGYKYVLRFDIVRNHGASGDKE
jgi:hypothetical protein